MRPNGLPPFHTGRMPIGGEAFSFEGDGMSWGRRALQKGRPELHIELVLDSRAPPGKSFTTGDHHHFYVHIHPDTPNAETIFHMVRRRLAQIFAARLGL